MPGIAGFIGAAARVDGRTILARMLEPAQHGPDYSSGSIEFAGLNAALGWTCHKRSFSDCLPVWNETRDVCLLFCGEHFDDVTTVQQLKAARHAVSADHNAEWLVHLYEEQEARFFDLLNGSFHGVVIDLRCGKVVLFNDRYGLGRIYYHEAPDTFYFAAEAKSLLRAAPQLRQLDTRSFGEFFSCGCALQNRTLFRNVSLLPPGSAWTFSHGKPVQKSTYFRSEAWEEAPLLPPEEYYQRLKATFTRVLPRYFNGQQAVALSLTGGLDSRMVIASAPHQPGSLPCYTFGGMYRECEDVRVGRQIAHLCHQPHQVIPVGQDFFPEFLQAARQCIQVSDGAMDVSGAVDVFVNRKAREVAPVRMTGNYGSEILRLNVAFKPMPLDFSMLSPELQASTRDAVVTYLHERNGNLLSFIAFKQVPWHHFCRFAEENSLLTIRSPFLDKELVRLAYQAPPGLLLNKQFALRYCSEQKPTLGGVPTDRGNLDRPAIVPEKVYRLWKERWPKAEYYFDYGMPQWLAKLDTLLAPFGLENYFLGQQKFSHFRTWYRHQLAPIVREVLLDPATLGRPYLNAQRVRQMVEAHTTGSGNYTLEIHKLLSSEFIQRLLLAPI